jgi:hypothetical protein
MSFLNAKPSTPANPWKMPQTLVMSGWQTCGSSAGKASKTT